jgi:hypothetical protein
MYRRTMVFSRHEARRGQRFLGEICEYVRYLSGSGGAFFFGFDTGWVKRVGSAILDR